jgi:hypothetical protein
MPMLMLPPSSLSLFTLLFRIALLVWMAYTVNLQAKRVVLCPFPLMAAKLFYSFGGCFSWITIPLKLLIPSICLSSCPFINGDFIGAYVALYWPIYGEYQFCS